MLALSASEMSFYLCANAGNVFLKKENAESV